jgi:hypothetical protein
MFEHVVSLIAMTVVAAPDAVVASTSGRAHYALAAGRARVGLRTGQTRAEVYAELERAFSLDPTLAVRAEDDPDFLSEHGSTDWERLISTTLSLEGLPPNTANALRRLRAAVVAVVAAPQSAQAQYELAAALALSRRESELICRLRAYEDEVFSALNRAVALDPKLRARALKDPSFSRLHRTIKWQWLRGLEAKRDRRKILQGVNWLFADGRPEALSVRLGASGDVKGWRRDFKGDDLVSGPLIGWRWRLEPEGALIFDGTREHLMVLEGDWLRSVNPNDWYRFGSAAECEVF